VSGAFAGLVPVVEEVQEVVNNIIDDQAVSNLRSALSKKYNEEKSLLESLTNKMKSFIDQFKNFQINLTQGALSPLTPGEKYAAARQEYDSTVATIAAGGGDAIAAAERYTSVAQTFLEASQIYNASNSQYRSDFELVKSHTATGISLAQKEFDIASQQLASLEYQTRFLLDISADTRTIADLMHAAYNTPGISANPEGTVTQLYFQVVGRAPDPEGLKYWSDKLRAGETIQSLISQAMQSPEAIAYQNRLAGHAGGLSNVPYNNYVFRAHQGEAILSRSQASMWRSGGMGLDIGPLVARLNMLIDEVSELRDEQVAGFNAEIATIRQASQASAETVAEGVSDGMSRTEWMRKQKREATLE
jgi:hypothetical protein